MENYSLMRCEPMYSVRCVSKFWVRPYLSTMLMTVEASSNRWYTCTKQYWKVATLKLAAAAEKSNFSCNFKVACLT